MQVPDGILLVLFESAIVLPDWKWGAELVSRIAVASSD